MPLPWSGSKLGSPDAEEGPTASTATAPARRRRTAAPWPDALRRRFEAIVFDWDGTAVPDRAADAARVRRLLESLSALGFDVGVVSGTHVGNVDAQLAARPSGPGRLFLCLNRGSEVYAVGPRGPVLVERRVASAEEDAALTAAAERTVSRLAARGLRAEIVSQRLNRRKIDLIPEPEWADPPKARIAELLRAVEERLHDVGFRGLTEVAELALAEAARAGLADARVTSDAKHVEIGLTDKSDSARWLVRELARRGVDADAILVAGDEFGPLGGLPGSDSLMLVPELAGAVAVSVGAEPEGVPDGVLLLRGGPAAFERLLRDQLRRRRALELPAFAPDPEWSICLNGLDPVFERAHEALLAFPNGAIGTAGAPLLRHPSAAPRTLAGGVYDGNGAETHLLPWPAWERLDGELGQPARLERRLDLRRGLLVERLRGGKLDSIRFAPLGRHGAGVLRARFDEQTCEPGPPLAPANGRKRWTSGREDGVAWSACSTPSGRAVAAATEAADRRALDRFAVFRRGERAKAIAAAAALRGRGFDALLCEQRSAWGDRWEAAAIAIDGDPELQLAARLALFHLLGSASAGGESAVGARGLTGHGYRGHVFWDADVFVLPALAATEPALARSMLEYRLRRLNAARAEARASRRAGARFPWESARSGRDVTPARARLRIGTSIPILTGELEEHVVADVAWAAAQYVAWTGDGAFARGPGLVLLVETARYWASRVRLDEEGLGHVEHVIGPDEYHEDVDDNAFTNVMARWNLRAAAAAVAADGRTCDVDERERLRWLALADALVDGYDPATRLYEQFAGFYELDPLVIADFAPRRPVAAEILLGVKRLRASQVVKQADVLMLHHLVPEEAAPGSLRANLRFYEPRTAHGSSLSPGIHASLFARSGMHARALEALRLTARIDLDDLTETTAAGVHLATMGSLWQALVFGFGGVRPLGDRLAVDPHLPPSWDALELRVTFRGARTRLRLAHDEVLLSADRPVTFAVGARRTPVVVSATPVRLQRNARRWEEGER